MQRIDRSALSRLITGDVYVAGSSNEPTGILDALEPSELARGLRFTQFPLAGFNRTDFTGLTGDARMETFFMTPHLRGADRQRLQFMPMQMRYVFDYLSSRRFDTVLLQVARDSAGVLRLGPNVDFAAAALDGAGRVIAELNHAFTAPAGCPVLAEDRIDCVFETNRPLAEMAPPKIDDAAREIGRLVATLVDDGACIQTGIGAIPAAILGALTRKNDLGLHGGLLDEGGRALIEAGNVTGACKGVDTGAHVTGMALGTHALISWLADRPDVQFRGADHTHDVRVISRLDGFVSVNSAVEVDLHGQVNAEVAGGRQISGTGGSVDFMRGARMSPRGRSIVAMTATARDGQVSRIVPAVEVVTALRTDIDYVVTEYGIAHLKDLPLDARARALVDIAAPNFRDALAAATGP